MIQIINFDGWVDNQYKHNETLLSGKSRKEYLKDSISGKSGIFKYPKTLKTTEHVSERLAYDIARIIGVRCAITDIGTFREEMGSLSYLIAEHLENGTSSITKKYSSYDKEKHFDSNTKEYYSIHMIENSLNEFDNCVELLDSFYKMLLFDFLIGNSDRHSDNWGLVSNGSNFTFSPLFDNGSALCSYVKNADIESYFKDSQRYKSLVDTKSISKIRIDRFDKKRPKHSEVINHLKCINLLPLVTIEKINDTLNENQIEYILNEYPSFIIMDEKKELIKKYLLSKIDILNSILKGGWV